MKVSVIGAGSWGTALAMKSVEAGNETVLYCRRYFQAQALRETRENAEYLPGVILPDALIIESDLTTAVEGADIVLLVTPSSFVRETLLVLEPLLTKNMILVICSKGLERRTGLRMTEIAEELVGHSTKRRAVLYGPNHAEEVARGLPTATVVASEHADTARAVQTALSSERFRIYINEDVVGVEIGATTKNIIALAVGIADGLRLGDNIKAAIMTRGLHEMTKFGLSYGAKRETFAGLSGMGDLIATCISAHSRNRSAGKRLADGETMEDIMRSSSMVVEGFYAVPAVCEAAKARNLELPIAFAMHDLLFGHKDIPTVISDLMTRELKDELMIGSY